MARRRLTVRPATNEDADAVFALVQELAVTYAPTRDAFDRNYPGIVASGHQLLLVADDNGVVAGYAMASESLTLFANGRIIDLLELVVDPSSRKRGLGRRLVEGVIDWAREGGCAEVNVPTRRAGQFYERLGFEETASLYRLRI